MVTSMINKAGVQVMRAALISGRRADTTGRPHFLSEQRQGWQHMQCSMSSLSAPSQIIRSGCHRRYYFTNTDEMKKDDPYAQLGLTWGDATSTKDIKDAFRKKARELHPDVNTTDSPEQALRKFQQLQKAYQTLLGNADDGEDGIEEWRFAIWRNGDRIAQDRTDVAGMARKRPVQPASKVDVWASKQIGHPDGRGTTTSTGRRRAEYLGEGKSISSSVGTGKNKWVKPKKFKPWNPEETMKVRANNFAATIIIKNDDNKP